MTDTSQPNSRPDSDAQQARRGRIIAATLMAVVALPMVLAYVLYHTGVGIPEGQTNKGELLDPPQSFADWRPRTLDGTPWQPDPAAKRWRLIVPIDAECTGHCEDNLYLTRQVHVRLADKAHRVERLILPVNGQLTDKTRAFLKAEHPGTEWVQPDRQAMRASLAQTNLPQPPLSVGRYYLMDQEGFVMMGYTPEHSGNQLLKDLKRVLRYSLEN